MKYIKNIVMMVSFAAGYILLDIFLSDSFFTDGTESWTKHITELVIVCIACGVATYFWDKRKRS